MSLVCSGDIDLHSPYPSPPVYIESRAALLHSHSATLEGWVKRHSSRLKRAPHINQITCFLCVRVRLCCCCCLCRAHKCAQAALFKAGGGRRRRYQREGRESIYYIWGVVTRHPLQTDREGHVTLRAYKCEPSTTNSAISLAEMNLRLSPDRTHEAERLHRLPL